VVPEEVKARWKAVRIVVQDKQSGRDLVYTVDVGGRFALPDTALQVEVTHFLPAFGHGRQKLPPAFPASRKIPEQRS